MLNRRKGTAKSQRILLPPTMIAAAVLLVTACTTEKPAPPPAPTLDRFYHQTVSWGSCDGYPGWRGLTEAGLDCARIMVPVDYADPNGETARIAISRLRAKGSKTGSLLTNPGGPGGPGLDLPIYLGKTPLSEHFDIIGIDVRGLGASTPLVQCQTAKERMTDLRVLNTGQLVEIDEAEEEHENYANSCLRRTGAALLAHVGTVDVARDFDVIRAVLGDAKLTYFGASYGTRIGSTYAEMFPDRVRAMVLDAPVDPTTNIVDPVASAGGFQAAFDAYAADCAKSPDCPLGTDPKQTTDAYRKLVLPLMERPAPTADKRGLDYTDAITATISAMYSPKLWPALTKGLTELAHGHGDGMQQEATSYQESADQGLNQAVRCLENIRVTDRVTAAEIDRRARAAGPAFDDGLRSKLSALDTCAFWPIPTNAQPHQPKAPGLPKIVVVAAKIDPATPYQGALHMAQAFNAALITFDGVQHGAAFTSGPCVDEPVIKYLTDLTPPPDTNCPARAAEH
ncbi:alpha/beta hydrolase [Nocardia arthritidis]|uniref:Alpha/beta fold hydrolase n=1 Tax=Nocardia arthritidis TaxID=228602 RepID=A0A6G9Y7V8_9NOCA|nr:alpha/beta hydrolase [Nocardia arthritidis]QIS09177.1 alpha/beta fold hydrolase [Nocardia arthritidis]